MSALLYFSLTRVICADRKAQIALEQSENNTGGGEMQLHRSRDENTSRKRR
jgi:hypothetical protein